jgi:hypothetical protein
MEPLQILPNSLVHRIGGSQVENLRLKPLEAKLVPPGISLFVCDTPEQAAEQMRREFPLATRLIEASRTVASATVQAIRRTGFDVIGDPTKRFPNHARLIHAQGITGFNDEQLARL